LVVSVFFVFLSAYILSVFYRSSLAVVAPEVSASTGASLAELGLASAVWFLTFALSQVPVGWALDHYGPRRTVGYTVLVAAGGAALFAAAPNAFISIIAMGLLGIGCSAVLMGAVYAFNRLLDADTSARRSSWLLGLSTIGGLLAATPLAMATEAIGWRATFALAAVSTFLSALLILWRIPDLPTVAAGAQRTHDTDGLIAGLSAVLTIRGLWPLFPIIGVSYAVVAAERGLWSGPYFADVHGLETVARGNAVMVLAIAMTAGAFLLGEIDRATGRRKAIVVISSVITGVSFLALGYAAPSTASAVVLMAVIGVAGFTYGLLLAHGRAFLPDHLLGRGLTLMNFFFLAGAGLVQVASSALVRSMTAAGRPAPDIFAVLHSAFGVLLLVTTVIYASAARTASRP
jgi:sugar phosphate permease